MKIEKFAFQLLTKSMENVIPSCCYKQPDGNWKNRCYHQQDIPTNFIMENKLYFATGDFNLNCLEFHLSSEIRSFFYNMFEKGAISSIKRPTRVTTSNATLIDSIFANYVFDTSLKKGTIKASI